MNIQINNYNWIDIEKSNTGYYLTCNDINGNTFQVMNIQHKYLKQLSKDIIRILSEEAKE